MFYTSSRQVLVAKFTNQNLFFYQKECNMRGIETGKVRIRHEVFTEIARLAYEGGDYAKRLEELPFKIIPGEIGTYRDSIRRSTTKSRSSMSSNSPATNAPTTS
jgi:hypothetical protein